VLVEAMSVMIEAMRELIEFKRVQPHAVRVLLDASECLLRTWE
jgi:hypothetical protein